MFNMVCSMTFPGIDDLKVNYEWNQRNTFLNIYFFNMNYHPASERALLSMHGIEHRESLALELVGISVKK